VEVEFSDSVSLIAISPDGIHFLTFSVREEGYPLLEWVEGKRWVLLGVLPDQGF